ncbi:hypothetical protein E2C01_073598 [Portunus trituberculatus]|uniref:Uncharacterized protein n=1 Tax=Portunus trituberculatus TaxID=210409 RepID=A0A5B7IB05_PORTR|nr:hypothetical protein [Portunus trituberculatus]
MREVEEEEEEEEEEEGGRRGTGWRGRPEGIMTTTKTRAAGVTGRVFLWRLRRRPHSLPSAPADSPRPRSPRCPRTGTQPHPPPHHPSPLPHLHDSPTCPALM